MKELNLNVFNIIIISGVIHGVVFSCLVLSQKRFITGNTKYLGLVVLFLSFSNLQYWILDTKVIDIYPILKYIYIPWHWLVLPMFYFYVKRFIGRKPLNKKRIYTLTAPFLIVLLIHISQVAYHFFVDSEYDIPSHFGRGLFVYIEFFSVFFNVLLMFLTFKMISLHERDKSYKIEWVKSETSWLKKLIYIGVITCLFWLIGIVIVVVYDLNKSHVFYPMWIGISVLVYWIGYVGVQKSKQLKERIELRKKRIETLSIRQSSNEKKPSDAFDKIELYLKNNRPFLNSQISLKSLANDLNLSEGYLSQLINNNYHGNFNDYINSFRISEAKKILADKTYDAYTIAAIGLECGFNSKSSFYDAFKKHTETTPSMYKKEVRNL